MHARWRHRQTLMHLRARTPRLALWRITNAQSILLCSAAPRSPSEAPRVCPEGSKITLGRGKAREREVTVSVSFSPLRLPSRSAIIISAAIARVTV